MKSFMKKFMKTFMSNIGGLIYLVISCISFLWIFFIVDLSKYPYDDPLSWFLLFMWYLFSLGLGFTMSFIICFVISFFQKNNASDRLPYFIEGKKKL